MRCNKPYLDVGSGSSLQNYLGGGLHADIVRAPFVDVVCDIQHLPFRSFVFDKVTAFHVLEHVENPVQGLKECIRVAQFIVEVETPHRFSLNARQKGHVCSFRPSWFHKVLKNLKHHLENRVLYPGYIYIHVWIWKK